MYDTGGGYTVLDAAHAGAFGCKPYGRTVGFRLSGERVESQNCEAVTFDFGGFSITTEARVVDVNAFLPDGLPELAGIFSIQTFREHLVTIDYSGARLTIEEPDRFRARTREMTEIPLKVTNEKSGEAVTLFTQVLEAPEPLWFYMDSGNLRGVLVAPHAANLLGLDGHGHVTLHIAGFDYETAGEEMDIIYDGVLDVGFFKAHEVSLNLHDSRAWIGPRSSE